MKPIITLLLITLLCTSILAAKEYHKPPNVNSKGNFNSYKSRDYNNTVIGNHYIHHKR